MSEKRCGGTRTILTREETDGMRWFGPCLGCPDCASPMAEWIHERMAAGKTKCGTCGDTRLVERNAPGGVIEEGAQACPACSPPKCEHGYEPDDCGSCSPPADTLNCATCGGVGAECLCAEPVPECEWDEVTPGYTRQRPKTCGASGLRVEDCGCAECSPQADAGRWDSEPPTDVDALREANRLLAGEDDLPLPDGADAGDGEGYREALLCCDLNTVACDWLTEHDHFLADDADVTDLAELLEEVRAAALRQRGGEALDLLRDAIPHVRHSRSCGKDSAKQTPCRCGAGLVRQKIRALLADPAGGE